MKRVAIYLRVSTARQDTDNQRRELEAVGRGPAGTLSVSMRTQEFRARRAGTNDLGSIQ